MTGVELVSGDMMYRSCALKDLFCKYERVIMRDEIIAFH